MLPKPIELSSLWRFIQSIALTNLWATESVWKICQLTPLVTQFANFMQLTVKGWAFSSKMSKERTSLSLKCNLKTFQNFPININFVLTKVIKSSCLNFQKFYQFNGMIFFSLLRHNNHTNKFILREIFKIFPPLQCPQNIFLYFSFYDFKKRFPWTSPAIRFRAQNVKRFLLHRKCPWWKIF